MADGFDLVIAGARGNVMRILELTGVDETLPMAPDLTSALPETVGNASGEPRA
jgi:hypothetical protein